MEAKFPPNEIKCSRSALLTLGTRIRILFGVLHMQQPTINYSPKEIQEGSLQEIRWLEDVIARHPRWTWPPPILSLAREFQVLATEQPLDAVRTRGFTSQLRQHIAAHHLKGFEPFVWYAEALEYLARGNRDAYNALKRRLRSFMSLG